MKKTLLILGIIFAIIIMNITFVQAATATATLIPSSTSVKQGDTFTVTLPVICSAGINGVIAEYSYDTDKLELVEHKAVEPFMDLNGDSTSKIETMISGGSKTTADVFTLKFKVKDTATVGSTANVNIGTVTVDSDSDGEATAQVQSASIKVAESSSDTPSDTPTNTPANTSANPIGSSSTAKPTTSTTGTSAKTTDKTTASSVLPKTGLAAVTGIALVVIIAVAIVIFKKLKKYDGIE
ncbi:MAG: hypothetical protein IKF83_03385 [Clostridia bacterium]|nr:hypothetical protein [Clostridia bacterium]